MEIFLTGFISGLFVSLMALNVYLVWRDEFTDYRAKLAEVADLEARRRIQREQRREF